MDKRKRFEEDRLLDENDQMVIGIRSQRTIEDRGVVVTDKGPFFVSTNSQVSEVIDDVNEHYVETLEEQRSPRKPEQRLAVKTNPGIFKLWKLNNPDKVVDEINLFVGDCLRDGENLYRLVGINPEFARFKKLSDEKLYLMNWSRVRKLLREGRESKE